jgi:hypothetical protein
VRLHRVDLRLVCRGLNVITVLNTGEITQSRLTFGVPKFECNNGTEYR